MQRKPEAWPTRPRVTIELVLRRAHRLEPFRQRERVATIAPRGCAIATSGRVPRCLGPLDRRLVSHAPTVGPRCDSQEVGFGGPTPEQASTLGMCKPKRPCSCGWASVRPPAGSAGRLRGSRRHRLAPSCGPSDHARCTSSRQAAHGATDTTTDTSPDAESPAASSSHLTRGNAAPGGLQAST